MMGANFYIKANFLLFSQNIDYHFGSTKNG